MSVFQMVFYVFSVNVQMYFVFVFVQALIGDFTFDILKSKILRAVYILITSMLAVQSMGIKFFDMLPWSNLLVNELIAYVLIVVFVIYEFKPSFYVPFIVLNIYWLITKVLELIYVLILLRLLGEADPGMYAIQLVGSFYFGLGFLLFAFVISKFKFRYFHNFTVPRTIGTLIVVSPIVFVVSYNLLIIKMLGTVDTIGSYINSILAILAGILLVYFWIYQRNKNVEMQVLVEEMDALEGYAKTVDQLYNDIRFYKHDISNILSGFRLYIEQNDMDGLTAYYNEKVMNLPVITDPTYQFIGIMQNIKNIPLKGLLLSKFELMKSKGVNFTLDEAVTLNSIPMDDMDMVRVMGVILDNAMEAAVESEKKLVVLSVAGEGEDGSIKITNTVGDMPDLEKIMKVDYSTKGSGRGLGLSSVTKTVDSYDNVNMRIGVEKEHFYAVLEY